MIEINSAANTTIKKLRSLKQKKYRDKEALFLIEGKKTILEAFDSGVKAEYLVLDKYDREIVSQAEKLNTPMIILTSYEILKTLSDTKNPPHILAYIRAEHKKVDMSHGVIIAMERISDPYNMGTIIRTADALGAAGVICGEPGCDIYNPKVQRAAMGSFFHIAVEETDVNKRLKEYKKDGGYIISAALEGKEALPEIPLKVCLVVGNESAGVSDEVKRLSDFVYKIPMNGKAESLNVSVACGIALFEIQRQIILSN